MQRQKFPNSLIWYPFFISLYYFLSLYMLMCKQMILTVFMIARTFRTISEFQVRIIQFSPSADGTPVLRSVRIHLYRALCLPDIFLKFSLSSDLLRRIRPHVPWSQEKDQEIQDGHHRSDCIGFVIDPELATAGRNACKTAYAKYSPSINARYFTLTGIAKNKRNCIFGYSAANAKNSDIFRYQTDSGSDIPIVIYTSKAAITWNTIPEKKYRLNRNAPHAASNCCPII